MEIERVDFKEEKTEINKTNKSDNFLIYLAVAGFILPLGFLLSIYVLIRIKNRKVSGNLLAAKLLSWIQISLTFIILIIMSLFPNILKSLVQ